MGFGVKAVDKTTGEEIWICPMTDIREIILEYGSTDNFVKSLWLKSEYFSSQYDVYTVQGGSPDTATSTLWVAPR